VHQFLPVPSLVFRVHNEAAHEGLVWAKVPLVIPLTLGVLLCVVLGSMRPGRECIDPRCR
jgi:hypothetical protein